MIKMKKLDIRRVCGVLLALLLAAACLPLTRSYAAQTSDVIHIASEADLAELARQCALDTWSRGRTVVLDNDLALEDGSFLPIPSFGGVFDGQGHAIRGIRISGSLSPAGLFGVVQTGGVVRDLRAEGAVTPEGDARNVGGIAGENRGTIEDCSFTGTVSGKTNVGGIAGANMAAGSILHCQADGAAAGEVMTGGIVGYNEGLAASCENNAFVNVESTDPRIDLDDLTQALTMDLSALSRLNAGTSVTDTGGIAGYSAGTIADCVNHGAVGYQHIGYNTGGIVGRSCGQLRQCANDGAVCGRKDVGGIAGQIEPYIRVDDTDYLSEMNRQLYELRRLTDQAVSDAQDGSGDISGQLGDMNDYLRDNVSDPGDLAAIIHGFGQRLDDLNSTASGSADAVAEDLRAVNEQFNRLSNTMLAALSAASDPSSLVSDTSEVNVDSVTLGKTSDCRNSGTVDGDSNTGGIAGSMAVEYGLDPEDDVSADLSGSYRRQYEYKAIVQRCVNTGAVTAKRSNVGGIAGRMDLGFITGCESYGGIDSENGSYVGGIAGITAATVRSSYAKCALSGKQYVGGIVGAGTAEKSDGGASTVADCWSLVDITACQQYEGAVSGSDAGTFERNYFVSDTLAGINRQSYGGRAEPAAFAVMAENAAVPDSMKRFTLSFVEDGAVISSRSFDYGDSFDSSVFPALPVREGSYAHWDRSDLRDLRFDTVVTAVYDAYMPALACQQSREDGRSVILAEGLFSDDNSLIATAHELTPEAFHITEGGVLAGWWAYWREGSLPPAAVNRQVLEQWQVSLPDDGQTRHTLRYLPPEGAAHLTIYVNNGSGWQEADCGSVGSYLTFTVEGRSPMFAAVTSTPVWWMAAAAAGLCAAVVLTVVLLRLRRRKKAAKAALPEAADAPAPEGAGTASGESAPSQPKKRRWWIPVSMAAGIAAAMAVILTTTGLGSGLRACSMLTTALRAEPAAMTVRVDSGSGAYKADVYRVKAGGTTVTTVTWEGVSVYCVNGTVYLENGRAFRQEDALSPSQAAALFRKARVDFEKTDEGGIYTMTLDEDTAAGLLALLPEGAADTADVSTLTMILTTEDGRAVSLALTAGSEEDALSIRVDFLPADVSEAPAVPQAVTDAIAEGGKPEGTLPTGDTLRLLRAWASLRKSDVLAADLTLTADCGPLVLRDTVQYDRRTVNGQDFSCVRRGGLTLYFSGDKLCDAEGHALTVGDSATEQPQLIELAYQLVLSGDAACTRSGETDIYTLKLDEAGAADFAAAIAPDIQSQHAALTGGELVLEVRSGYLRSIRVTCMGTVRVAMLEADASLGAEIALVQRNYPFPQKVLTALQ